VRRNRHWYCGSGRKEKTMSIARVEEIQVAIESLPYQEYVRLRQWLTERDWRNWDRQIEADSESGKLDFSIEEALKGVIIELAQERRDLFLEMIVEAIEEIGLANAIREGRQNEYVSEESIVAILEGQA
jgi:hypothetical protein